MEIIRNPDNKHVVRMNGEHVTVELQGKDYTALRNVTGVMLGNIFKSNDGLFLSAKTATDLELEELFKVRKYLMDERAACLRYGAGW